MLVLHLKSKMVPRSAHQCINGRHVSKPPQFLHASSTHHPAAENNTNSNDEDSDSEVINDPMSVLAHVQLAKTSRKKASPF